MTSDTCGTSGVLSILLKKILDLDAGKVKSILKLIDLKTNNDMDKFITEMKRIEDKIDTRTSMILWAMGILIALLLTVIGKSLIS
jgi:hypothetical protein